MKRGNRTDHPDQLKRLKAEVASGAWLRNAQQRSSRRKSLWNLLLPMLGLPLWGACTFGLDFLGRLAHGQMHGMPAGQTLRQFMTGPMGAGDFLIFLPSLFAAIAPAFLITNAVVYRIGPARRAMDQEDRAFPGSGYASSQEALGRVARWLLGFWLACVLIAAAIP